MIVLERGRLLRGEGDAPGQQRLVVFEASRLGQPGEQRAQVAVSHSIPGIA